MSLRGESESCSSGYISRAGAQAACIALLSERRNDAVAVTVHDVGGMSRCDLQCTSGLAKGFAHFVALAVTHLSHESGSHRCARSDAPEPPI